MRRIGAAIAVVFTVFLYTGAQAASFADWGAIVVAGDHKAHDGSDSEVFDNARRDISSDLLRLGFNPLNIDQFSTMPDRYSPRPMHSDLQTISNALWDLSNRAKSGCFVYITSHGSPDGVVVNDNIATPAQISNAVNNACGSVPTVVFVSACFSGVFVPALKGDNRFVMTAARPDRTSFGCGQADRYTYFDQCFLESFPGSHDFPGLASAVTACVAAREKKEDMSPPSEPQTSIGATAQAGLPHW